MKFFNIDLHISVIADIKYIFKELGHEVTDWSISGHAHVFGNEYVDNGIIGKENWTGIDEELCEKFYSKYKDVLSVYDCFICTYPPCFSLLYEKFNKPIILVCPIRYEYPFHSNKKKWIKFNSYLINGVKNKKIIPVANNKYDVEYCKYFTGIDFEHIPSLCRYVDTEYDIKKVDDIHCLIDIGKIHIGIPNLVRLKSPYLWSDLGKFKSAVFIPYNASIMKIFEWYRMSCPMFFPSIDFLEKMRFNLYSDDKYGVMHHLSFNRIHSLRSKSYISCKDNDPNDYENKNVFRNWVKYSDFYDEENMPYISYFSSFVDLSRKIKSIDHEDVSNKMKLFNVVKKKNVYKKWESVIASIEK